MLLDQGVFRDKTSADDPARLADVTALEDDEEKAFKDEVNCVSRRLETLIETEVKTLIETEVKTLEDTLADMLDELTLAPGGAGVGAAAG